MNEYFDHINAPPTGSQLSSAIIRAEFGKIEAGFDKLPTLAMGANKLVQVNASGNAMVATDTPDINGGTIDGAAIGSVTPSTGAFTTLSASASASVPTLAADTNTTGAASTAFVIGQGSVSSPVMDGVASFGVSPRFARGDHVHPTDTSRAPVASPTLSNPTLTGTVTVPTPTNPGDVTTKTYVDAALALKANLASPTISNPTLTGTVTVPTPSAGTDAANKSYVDAAATTGLDVHDACDYATTANIALSGFLTIDGTVTTGSMRILVKGQTTTSQNGIYTPSAGAWTRTTDADATGEIKPNTYVFVNGGTVNAKTGWIQQTTGTITIGSTAIVFAAFSSSQAYVAGSGLTLTGNSFAITAPVTVALGGSGATTLTGILKGNGTGAFTAAASSDVTTLIGATAVTNATNATNSTSVGITNDTTTNATMYPLWATANTGNLPAKVTSTKLTFNPSTGILTATGFAGSLTGNASTATSATSATTATHLAAGVAGAVHWQSGAGASGFTAAGTSGQALLSGGATVPTWGTLGIAAGGTGATTAALARTALGVPALDGTGGVSGTWSINVTGSAGSATTAATATVANGINTATTTVVVSAATAPTTGQVLTATSSTAATWQAPSAGVALSSTLPAALGTAAIGVGTTAARADHVHAFPEMTVSVVSGTTQTAVKNTHYVITNVAATTVTLPAGPASGDTVWVTWTNSLLTNVIARNGQTIMDDATDMTLDALINGTVQLRFLNSSWRIL